MSIDPRHADGVAFEDIRVEKPQIEKVGARYKDLEKQWAAAANADARLEVFAQWDALRRKLESWAAMTRLRFDQDTTDAARKKEREYLDEISPRLTAFEAGMQRMLLGSEHRAELEQRLGSQLFALWEADVAAFAPAIEADLTAEFAAAARYTELKASARIEIDGTSHNLAGLEPFLQSSDREVRHRTQALRDAFYAEHAAEFDSIYDELVSLRDGMARTLGYPNFIGLAYKRMHRIGYGQADVERYRESIVRYIVPIAREIMDRRTKTLGLDAMMYWDETVAFLGGNPVPKGGNDWVIDRCRGVLASVNPEVGAFYGMMIDNSLVDLVNRNGKAGGGYQTSFPDYGVPFVFTSFEGTHNDIRVLVHEMGHAFQNWQSRNLPVFDYLSPTLELAEVHSMGMEYLSAAYVEAFFGDDAERYRREHLEEAMLFLPYGAAIDHFQHLVYAEPKASPVDRHAMWQKMEARYMPWRRYGDLSYFARGGLWQDKLHTYKAPFYYIDYTLALCCALQLWVRSRRDRAGAVADYVSLCARGGSGTFTDSVRSANLASPFEEGTLERVAAEVRAALSQ